MPREVTVWTNVVDVPAAVAPAEPAAPEPVALVDAPIEFDPLTGLQLDGDTVHFTAKVGGWDGRSQPPDELVARVFHPDAPADAPVADALAEDRKPVAGPAKISLSIAGLTPGDKYRLDLVAVFPDAPGPADPAAA